MTTVRRAAPRPWIIANMAKRPGKIGIIVGTHRYLCQETAEISFRSYFREHATEFRLLEPLVNLEDARIAHEGDPRHDGEESRSGRALHLRRRHGRRHRGRARRGDPRPGGRGVQRAHRRDPRGPDRRHPERGSSPPAPSWSPSAPSTPWCGCWRIRSQHSRRRFSCHSTSSMPRTFERLCARSRQNLSWPAHQHDRFCSIHSCCNRDVER